MPVATRQHLGAAARYKYEWNTAVDQRIRDWKAIFRAKINVQAGKIDILRSEHLQGTGHRLPCLNCDSPSVEEYVLDKLSHQSGIFENEYSDAVH
jgi:hypothetical protein